MSDTAAYVRGVLALLRGWDFEVVEIPGWETRGRGPMTTKGRIEHHTAGARTGDVPSLRVVTFGRTGLRNSLSRWYVSRSGVIYLVALNTSWHAGSGVKGTNSTLSGTEAEHSGSMNELWPTAVLDAMEAISLAECRVFGIPYTSIWEHKEHAGYRGKIDRIGITGGRWRERLANAELDNPEEDDIVASLEELEYVVNKGVDRLLDALREHEREVADARHLEWSMAVESIAKARDDLGLPPERESDAVWADRIADGRAIVADAREALQPRARIVAEIASARADAGLPPERESDWVWLRRIQRGDATMEDVRAALTKKKKTPSGG